MKHYQAFWEVDGFWAMAGVLILLVAVFTLAICTGPDEIPFDGSHDHSLSAADGDVKHAWEMTSAEWDALSPDGRAWYRNNITKGPRFEEVLR